MIHHPQLGNVSYELAEVSEDPREQVAQVIGFMRRYAVEDSRAPIVLADLDQALGQSGHSGQGTSAELGGGLSDTDKAAAIFYHVRGRVAFAPDEQTSSPLQGKTDIPIVEALVRPVDMAGMCNDGGCRRVGDCDDFAMYTAALLLAAGISCAYVTVAADPADPSRFSHVYVAAYTGDGRVALDTSHGEYPGWEAKTVYERREWPLTGDVAGLLPWLIAAGVAWWMARRSRVWRTAWA